MQENRSQWLAGLLDGDGHFYGRVADDDGPFRNPICRVRVRMISLAGILACKDVAEMGSIYKEGLTSAGHQIWSWEARGKENVESIIEHVLSNLVVRRENARTLHALLQTWLEPDEPLTAEVIATRHRLHERLALLNREV